MNHDTYRPSPSGHGAATASFSAAVAALRSGLRAHLAGPSASDGGDLRRAIHLLCADARRRGLRAEQVIVLLKEAWASLPEVRALPQGRQRSEPLERIVSLCIDEFYSASE